MHTRTRVNTNNCEEPEKNRRVASAGVKQDGKVKIQFKLFF
jgi:hypothetical protein